MYKHFLLAAGLLLTVFMNSTFAEDTAGVSGKIVDASGHPVSNAKVSVGNKSDFTDDDGQYRIKGLAPGKHTLQVKKGKVKLEESIEIQDKDMNKTYSLKKSK